MKQTQNNKFESIEDFHINKKRLTFDNLIEKQKPKVDFPTSIIFKKVARTSLHVKYPKDFLWFDDDFQNDRFESIQDSELLKKLKAHTRRLKIFWETYYRPIIFVLKESKKNKEIQNLAEADSTHDEFESYPPEDVLITLISLIDFSKIIKNTRRLDKNRSMLHDKNLIYSYYDKYFTRLSDSLKFLGTYWNPIFLHPFYKLAISFDPEKIVHELDTEKYKKTEALFIRVSNSGRKRLRDGFEYILNTKKKLIIRRLDVYELNQLPDKPLDIGNYRAELNLIYNRVGKFSKDRLSLTADVIFPRNLIIDSFRIKRGIIGHVVLIFSSNDLSQEEADRCISEALNHGLNNLEHLFINTNSIHPSFASNGPEILRYSDPTSKQLLHNIADYMTIERRFVNPSGSPYRTSDPGHNCLRLNII